MSELVRDHYLTEDNLWHYTTCGLDCIYLESGFNISDDGLSYSIEDLDALYESIANVIFVLSFSRDLSDEAVKFFHKNGDVAHTAQNLHNPKWDCVNWDDINKLVFQHNNRNEND